MMEVFHVLMHHGFKPRKTLHFVAFAAEEGGLLGSTDLAQNYYVREDPSCVTPLASRPVLRSLCGVYGFEVY